MRQSFKCSTRLAWSPCLRPRCTPGRSADRGARRRHRRSAASDVDERGLGRGSTTSSSDYSSSDEEDEVGAGV